MELKKLLGQNIKKFRKINKITQEQLAEIIGVEVISVSSVETGRYFPSPDNLVKIAKALNTPISNLFDFPVEKSCENYIYEISQNLNLIKTDKVKLSAINLFIKNLIGV